MKKIIIFTSLALAIVVGVFLSRRQVDLPVIEPSPSTVYPAPTIVFVQGAPQNVRFTLASDYAAPATFSAQYFSTQPFHGEVVVRRLASTLNLPAPKTVDLATSKNIFWNTDDVSLSYSSKNSLSTMGLHYKSGGLVTNTSSARAAAVSLLSQIFSPKDLPHFSVISETQSQFEGGAYIDPENTAVVNFEFRINGIPVTAANFSTTIASVSVDAQNTILSASITFPPVYAPIEGFSQLVRPQDIVTNLNANKGLLISVRAAPTDAFGTDPVFTSVEIQKIILVYYYDWVNLTIRPAYLIDGVGKNESASQHVQYFLYATGE